VKPRQGKDWLRRVAAAVGAIAVIAVSAPAAIADESATPTTQARAYNADWVPYLDPPEKPAAVCLVDSGVDVTPDTPADSPDGPIVKRLALDGGPGTAASATWEGLHGTRMALVGAAPINGWGAVGFWPGARIVSIRAMPADQTTFPFDNYSRAIDLCTKEAATLRIVAVNLSLGCDCAPSADERARLDLQIANAHNNDQSVVAAAGNNGGPVGSPANGAGVLAVAAGDKTRALCSFSNRGADVDLVAPGCDIDLADSASGQLWSGYRSGTSGASMTTSVVLALLRSYRPDLGWERAEQLVTSSARATATGPVLDVDKVFRAAGLGRLVDAARARVPIMPSPAAGSLTPDGATGGTLASMNIVHDGGISIDASTISEGRIPPPKLGRLLRRGRRLTITVRNRPRNAQLAIIVERRRGEFDYGTVVRVQREAHAVTITLPKTRLTSARLQMRYIVRHHPSRTSPAVYRRLRG
jgi:hypothetical protein